MTDKIIEILYKRLAGGRLTPGESECLEEWISENPEKRGKFVDSLGDTTRLAEEYQMRGLIDSERPLRDMESRLDLEKKKRTWGWKVWTTAAAVVVGVIAVTALLPRENPHEALAVAETPVRTLSLDNMAPGASQAVVTLSDGDTMHVNGVSEIRLAEVANNSKGRIEDLKVEVPRGGEFVVVLEDSTKVWLNSASSLIYPAHFNEDNRTVTLKGEAYFAVAKEAHRPFMVRTAGQQVKVYGTEFNVRSYDEDKSVYTTLSSGKVSLSRLDGAGGEIFLSPGKQAVFDKDTHEARVRSVDIETVTGWRHGRFVFEEQTLLQIMQDLSRWYDFDFEFTDLDAASTVFMGSIPRYSNFKTAIAILEKSGNLKFEVSDNKLLISRKSN